MTLEKRRKRARHLLTGLAGLILLDDRGLLVDFGCELLLRHRLALGVFVLHTGLGHSGADAERDQVSLSCSVARCVWGSRRVDGCWRLGLVVAVKGGNALVVGNCAAESR